MKTIGNVLWVVLGGWIIALIYFLVGLVMCVTVIGIPFGFQLFKLGGYSLWPFGHELVYKPEEPGCLSLGMNFLWIVLGWWEIAILHLVLGLVFCVTVIGIPLGIQHFKLAFASVFPFGREIR